MRNTFAILLFTFFYLMSHTDAIAQSIENDKLETSDSIPSPKGNLLQLVDNIYDSYKYYLTGENHYMANEKNVSPPIIVVESAGYDDKSMIEKLKGAKHILREDLNDISQKDIIGIEVVHAPIYNSALFGTRGLTCVVCITVKKLPE